MPRRCANPSCVFDFYSMRAICPNPVCLERSQPGCGQYFQFLEDGTVEKLTSSDVPAEAGDVAWLCCYCAMQYEMAGPQKARVAPDPMAFVWRWEVENAGAGLAHELG